MFTIRYPSVRLLPEDLFERWLSMLIGDGSSFCRCAVLRQTIAAAPRAGQQPPEAAHDAPTALRATLPPLSRGSF
jgi:hypothetical protein